MPNLTRSRPTSQRAEMGTTVLEARNLTVGYGPIPVIRGINLEVKAGEIVALLGVNGAGKTTTVKALAGELKPSTGEIRYLGKPTTAPLHQRARQGLRLITEERSVFMQLTAAENLRLGGQTAESCLELFPEIESFLGRKAGLLSGGEQQMLTLARALACGPQVLLADELSLGLAPLILERLLPALRIAADHGTAILLVEQHVRDALEVADRAYLLNHGEIVLQGAAKDLSGQIHEIEKTYLAASQLQTPADGK